MCGIVVRQSPQPLLNSFTWKNSAVIILSSLSGIMTAKLLDEADTFEEFANIVCKVNFVINFTAIYTHVILKSSKLCGFVDNLEDIINNRM